MPYPDFFDQVPRITLRDPLAELLGSATGGLLSYGYADAVRLAGHSCPTVAQAYWLCVRAVKALYGDEMPVRGNIQVSLRDPLEAGTTGVTASVLGLLTGAASGGGFAGLGGQFVRRGLLQFDADIETELRFTRTDTGQAVLAQGRAHSVPGDPQTMRLMQLCLSGQATDEQRTAFGQLWQARVRSILLDHAWDDAVFKIRPA
ncbi:MAG: hypothetical protein Q7T10_03975 [Rhodoferax sp.]|uniref:hypothetical protein n=1 Tax=Rhodoferax sp. TaxID=50421 RepID=UPI00271A1DB7|nr:hypothetical protein [Rhodoferax sp.]MDO8447945.1 hypothetical protein [Rhodoferax sp.]